MWEGVGGGDDWRVSQTRRKAIIVIKYCVHIFFLHHWIYYYYYYFRWGNEYFEMGQSKTTTTFCRHQWKCFEKSVFLCADVSLLIASIDASNECNVTTNLHKQCLRIINISVWIERIRTTQRNHHHCYCCCCYCCNCTKPNAYKILFKTMQQQF